MHLFKLHTLLYLSCHVGGYVLTLISVLGTPGNLDESKSGVKLLSKIINILILLGWYGIGVLAFVSIVCFYFEVDSIGKMSAIISLAIGICLLLSMVILYNIKDKKRSD